MTPVTDQLERDINAWFEGENREGEKLAELYAQLRLMEQAGRLSAP